MFQLTTKRKITLGYLFSVILLIATIGYIYAEMHSLTHTDDYDTILSQRRRTTNEIIKHLNLNAADRIILLRNGKVAENGSPADVMDNSTDPETQEFFASYRRR